MPTPTTPAAAEPTADQKTDAKDDYNLFYEFSNDEGPPKGIAYKDWFFDRKRRGSKVYLSYKADPEKQTELTRQDLTIKNGAFGVVWSVVDETHKFIVKAPVEGVFPPQIISTVYAHWRREADLMEKVYPGKVYLTADTKKNTFRLVMPLLGDNALFEAIKKYPDEKFDIFKAALTALTNLHALGIVHGDIKANNIRMKKIDGKWHAFIIDFGEAYMVGSKCRTFLECFNEDEYFALLSKKSSDELAKIFAIEDMKKQHEAVVGNLADFSLKVCRKAKTKFAEAPHLKPERFHGKNKDGPLIADFSFDIYAFVAMLCVELKLPLTLRQEIDSVAKIEELISSLDKQRADVMVKGGQSVPIVLTDNSAALPPLAP